jgi:exodeoxyribonuclease-3
MNVGHDDMFPRYGTSLALRRQSARDTGLRIDHFLLSPGIAARLVAAGVDREARSWEKSSYDAPA